MRLRTIATMLGALATVAGSFWITLSVLRYMDVARAPASVQVSPSAARTNTTSATRVPFDSFYVNPGSSFSGDAGERLLATSTELYSYAASAPLSFPPFGAGRGKIRARLQVLQGQLGISIVERMENSPFIAEKTVDVTNQPVQVDLDLPDATKARYIILRNLSPTGTRARARILSIEAVL